MGWRERILGGLLAAGLALAPAAAFAQEAVEPTSALAPGPLTVLYTGFSQGLSSGTVDFEELTPLLAPEAASAPSATGFTPDNAFRQGDVIVYASAGPLTLEDLEAFSAAGGLQVQRLAPARALLSDYAYVLESRPPAKGRAEWLADDLLARLKAAGKYPDVSARSVPRFALVNAAKVRLEGFALSADADLGPARFADLPGWEMLPAGAVSARKDGQKTPAIAIGRPIGDGLKRAALLRKLRAEAPTPPLILDAGNLVEPGVSDWSATARAFTLEKLSALGYDAIVPAENELALPEEERARLAAIAPLVATNLAPRDPQAPWPFKRRFETRRAGLDVAVVGVVDDRALERAGLADDRQPWRVGDPVAAAKQEVAELLKRPKPPEAILVVSNVRDARLHDLRHILGATAVVGDFAGLPGDTYREAVSLAGIPRARSLIAPLVAHSSKSRVGELTIHYRPVTPDGGSPLLALSNEAKLVADWLLADPDWRRRFARLKDAFQRARQAILLPDPRELPTPKPGWSQALWNRLVAQAVKEASGAEVALFRAPALAPGALGPLNRLMVEASLETREKLVSLAVPGSALKAMAELAADGAEFTVAGYDAAAQTVAGAKVEDDELYRVITTEGLWRHPRYSAALAAKYPAARFVMASDGSLRADEGGEPVMLKDVVLARLLALGRAGGPFGAEVLAALDRWLAPEAAGPRWSVRLEDGQLDANGTQVANTAPYSQVRNSRVTAPNAFSIGGKGKLIATYDAPDFALEPRVTAVYRRQSISKTGGAYVNQETDDQIAFTMEGRLKRWAPALFGLTPYVNGSYLTEFVPDVADDGTQKPRRSELNAVGGFILPLGYGFKELRFGAIVRNDLANPTTLEPGVTGAITFERSLSPWLPATFKSGLDVTQYLQTPLDKADRLGLLSTWTTALSVPIWERFTLTFATDYFVFRGKVPETSALGTNFVARVALGYQLTFKPLAGLWF